MASGESLMNDLPDGASAEVAALAKRMRKANGPLMRVLNRVGGKVEERLEVLPVQLREGLSKTAASILEQVYTAAARVGSTRVVPKADSRLHRLAAVASGAAGGAAGLGSAVVADGDDPSAIFHNPAGLAGADGVQVELSAGMFLPRVTFYRRPPASPPGSTPRRTPAQPRRAAMTGEASSRAPYEPRSGE